MVFASAWSFGVHQWANSFMVPFMLRSRLLHGTLIVGYLLLVPLRQPALAGSDFETYGDVTRHALPGFALVYSLLSGDREGALQLGKSWAVSNGIVLGLKHATDIDRPNGEPRSFPSGHAANAFVGASYVHYRYGFRYAAPLYVAAGLVGYSRIDADQHRWEDVIAGAVVGSVITYLFTDRFTPPENVEVTPGFTDMRNFSLAARIKF